MLRAFLLLPFLIVLMTFALSNPQPVTLAIWPFDYTVDVPISLAILTASGTFFFLGALIVWIGAIAAGQRAARAERRSAALEAELRTREAARPAPPRGKPSTILVPALSAPK